MLKSWRTTSSESLFSTPRVEVRRDQVVNPGGQAHPYDHVVLQDSVRVVALNRAGEVLLIDQEHYLPEQRLLQLPGGGLDPGEEPRAAAVRELEEETGLRGGEWVELGSWWPLPAMTGCRAHAFLVTGWSVGASAPEASEADLKVVWVPAEEAVGRVGCAVSAAALATAMSNVAEQHWA